jgi:hypothetical protein
VQANQETMGGTTVYCLLFLLLLQHLVPRIAGFSFFPNIFRKKPSVNPSSIRQEPSQVSKEKNMRDEERRIPE